MSVRETGFNQNLSDPKFKMDKKPVHGSYKYRYGEHSYYTSFINIQGTTIKIFVTALFNNQVNTRQTFCLFFDA